MDGNRMKRDDRGVALLGAVLIVSMLTVLGVLSLNLSIQEVQSTRASADEASARNLAESGADLMLQWFHDPNSAPAERLEGLFTRKHHLPDEGPSFFDEGGHSQFTGTASDPDLVVDASRPEDDRLLNDRIVGWFRALKDLGRIHTLKVYGPTSPGLLNTVEVTAETSGIRRTIAVQMGARRIPPLRAGAQISVGGGRLSPPVSQTPMPVWVHWGDLKIKGDAHLGSQQDVPVKTHLAAVTGQSYSQMVPREDRWLNIWIGGAARFSPSRTPSFTMPANVHENQDPIPGLHVDQWEYETMKRQALQVGRYYARGQDGLLYKDGTMTPGSGQTADSVFESRSPGDHRGLVFVDTLDQQAPGPNNLGSLSLRASYAEGVFIVNAHVRWIPGGLGRSVSAFSPPTGGTTSLGQRVPIQLPNVNLHGVLYTAGDLIFEGNPRVYGGVVVGGSLRHASAQGRFMEIWYDEDLRRGLFKGIPLVFLAPGTWQERY